MLQGSFLPPSLPQGRILASAALVLALLAGAAPSRAEDQALLLSVSRHRNDLWALDMARTNVRLLHDRLREEVGIPSERIETLEDDGVTRLVVRKTLARLAREAKQGDRLFLYFTGHGTKVTVSGAPIRAYFTYDTDPNPWGGEGYDPDTLILDTDLAQWVMPWRHAGGVVIFLREACFTGGGYSQTIGRASPGRPPEDLHVGDVELSACDVDEAAWPKAGTDPLRGLFTDALCDALSAPASRLTVAQVYAALRARMASPAAEGGSRQTPKLYVDPTLGLDDMLFVDRTLVDVTVAVMDAVTGEAIPGARVRLGEGGEGQPVPVGRDGTAEFHDTPRPAGAVLLPWAEAEGYVPGSARVALSPRQRRARGEVRLDPLAARVRGLLVEASSRPLSGVRVTYDSPGARVRDPRHFSGEVSPGVDGSFEISVPPGAPCTIQVIDAKGGLLARRQVASGSPLEPFRRWDPARGRYARDRVYDLGDPIEVRVGSPGPRVSEAEGEFKRWYGAGEEAEAKGRVEEAIQGYRLAAQAADLVAEAGRKKELSSIAKKAIDRVQGALDERRYASLCDEAERLLQGGDADAAGRKVEQALALRANGAKAKLLRRRIEWFVAEPAGADAGRLPPGFLDRFEILDGARSYKNGRKGLANGEWAPCDLPVEVRHKKSGIVMRLVPPGWFWMGAGPGDDLAEGDEKPRHRVTITKPFYLGKTEVTWEEWERNRGSLPRPDRPEWASDDRMPVVNVSWEDCKSYCDRLGLRLPSEAEWEYAARAGVASRWPWGDDPDRGAGYANVLGPTTFKKYEDPYNRLKKENPNLARFIVPFDFDDGFVELAPAGSFRPNAVGLHDTIGNVWEWCLDWFDSGVYGRHRGGAKDPEGPSSGQRRVLRGGSWFYIPRSSRLSFRLRDDATVRHASVGCRVASDP